MAPLASPLIGVIQIEKFAINMNGVDSEFSFDLVLLAQGGNRGAFDALVHHYRPALLALAFLRTREVADAEDIVQRVLLRLWENLPRLREPSALVAWLRTTCANVGNSGSSHTVPSYPWSTASQVATDPSSGPMAIALAREGHRELYEQLWKIPAANRIALLMYELGDYSYEEIAQFAGVPVTTVEGRIYRAKRQLRRSIKTERRLAPYSFSVEPTLTEGTQE